MKTVAVIGAGVAGLTAAVRLQYLGYQVTLFEKGGIPGGKMNQIQQAGFTFDVGPTIVMMPEVYREIFTFCQKDPAAYLPMQRVDPMLTLNFPQGEVLAFSNDLVELTKELEKISPEDAQGYMAFLADIYRRYLIAKKHFITKSFRHPWDFYNPQSLLAGLQLRTFSNAYSAIKKFVKDERLRNSLAFQTLYIGVSPYQGPSLYTLIPMIELFYGVHYLQGGMYTLARSLATLFAELGGRSCYDTAIEEIVIEQRAATGVKILGQAQTFDKVVCAADFPYAMKSLVKEQNRGKYTNQKIERWEYSCSCFVLYLGLDQKYPPTNVHNIYFADDFKANVDALFTKGELATDFSYYIYRPGLVDESLAPANQEGIYILVPVPELTKFADWSDATIQEYRDLVIAKIQANSVFSDLNEHIVFETCFTPERFAKEFNAYHGATFGLKPTLAQSNYYRPHNKFPYAENLYFCGSSTHPGAGVPIVMQSAKLAVEELLRDDHQK